MLACIIKCGVVTLVFSSEASTEDLALFPVRIKIEVKTNTTIILTATVVLILLYA